MKSLISKVATFLKRLFSFLRHEEPVIVKVAKDVEPIVDVAAPTVAPIFNEVVSIASNGKDQ